MLRSFSQKILFRKVFGTDLEEAKIISRHLTARPWPLSTDINLVNFRLIIWICKDSTSSLGDECIGASVWCASQGKFLWWKCFLHAISFSLTCNKRNKKKWFAFSPFRLCLSYCVHAWLLSGFGSLMLRPGLAVWHWRAESTGLGSRGASHTTPAALHRLLVPLNPLMGGEPFWWEVAESMVITKRVFWTFIHLFFLSIFSSSDFSNKYEYSALPRFPSSVSQTFFAPLNVNPLSSSYSNATFSFTPLQSPSSLFSFNPLHCIQVSPPAIMSPPAHLPFLLLALIPSLPPLHLFIFPLHSCSRERSLSPLYWQWRILSVYPPPLFSHSWLPAHMKSFWKLWNQIRSLCTVSYSLFTSYRLIGRYGSSQASLIANEAINILYLNTCGCPYFFWMHMLVRVCFLGKKKGKEKSLQLTK